MYKRWELAKVDEKQAYAISKDFKIPLALARILASRQITIDKIAEFLNPEDIPYVDPFELKEMQLAVTRIAQAYTKNEKICIYGDYDVDGVSSTVLLVKVLRELGCDVNFYLPHRHSEGYGLHIESLEQLIPQYDLIITVDCGITAVAEAEFCQGKIDLIITDHHLPGEELPVAIARINPNQSDCPYPNKNLCGVGVAFKLCQALYMHLGLDHTTLEKYLDIVALGTIADLVPLIWENRRIVKRGLANINNSGMKSLLELSHADLNNVNAGHIGFGVAPRLNAAGRLAHASAAVEILLEDDPIKINEQALFLDGENRERQQLVEEIVIAATDKVEQEASSDKIIVVIGHGWNEGVIGIAASRLQEKYYKPIIIIAVHDGKGKASCRSIENFHIKEALDHCKDLLEVYGGHSMAAGFTINEELLPKFVSKITNYANDKLSPEDLIPIIKVDAIVQPQEISLDFIEMLNKLEPYGMGNPKPQFVSTDLDVFEARSIGKEHNHLKVKLKKDYNFYDGIAWNMAERIPTITSQIVDIVYQPEINEWRDLRNIQFKLTDIRVSEYNAAIECPGYVELGKLYLTIVKQSELQTTKKLLITDLPTIVHEIYGINLSMAQVTLGITILEELSLLKSLNASTIELLPKPEGKLDITMSPTYIKYKEGPQLI